MKVGIIGTGNMGRALGLRFALAAHSVFFGGRDPSGAPARAAEKARSLLSTETGYGSTDEAADFGEVLIWTPRDRAPAPIFSKSFDMTKLDGKIIVDLNNRSYAEDVAGPSSKWFERSLGEELQDNLARSKVVKCFNTIPMGVLDVSAERLRESNAQVFIAANDDDAARTVGKLAEDVGFGVVYLGGGPTAMRSADALGDVIRWILIDQGMKRSNIGIVQIDEPDLDIVGPREESKYS